MGYCMNQQAEKFTIKAENMAGAMKAVRDLDGKEAENGGRGYSPRGAHYAWVSRGFSKGKTTLEALMGEWRWMLEVEQDDAGREHAVAGIMFEGEKLGDDMILFEAIAPFVEPGSYIEMHGEDGSIWRYCFDGETCVEKSATVTFE